MEQTDTVVVNDGIVFEIQLLAGLIRRLERGGDALRQALRDVAPILKELYFDLGEQRVVEGLNKMQDAVSELEIVIKATDERLEGVRSYVTQMRPVTPRK